MPVALGRLVVLALGCFYPLRGSICADELTARARRRNAIAGLSDGLSDGFPDRSLDGFTPQPAVQGHPPQVGFRRPQQAERQKRDCLMNGTNFCFGDSNSYCSACGTCCSDSGNSNNKWCCPSGGVCCGSSCCGGGQTCKNGECYLPVETVTATSSMFVTSTHIVTSIATVFQKVVDSSVIDSVVEVTNTNAQTQTNWVYVTATIVGKRAGPSAQPLESGSGGRSGSTGSDGGTGSTRNSETTGATGTNGSSSINNDNAGKATSTLPIPTITAIIVPVPASTTAPTTPTDAIASEPVQPRQAATEATMPATQSTSTVNEVVIATAIITNVIFSTTTIATTTTNLETIFETKTVVLNAKTTVAATSTVTYTSHHPITLTVTAVATVHPSNTASSSGAAPALVTGSADATATHSSLSSSATAGIAVGSSIFGLAVCLLVFFFARRHYTRKKELRAITEEYAYLGTGRSNGCGGMGRSNSCGAAPPPHNNVYSGPPPPSARMSSVREPAMKHMDLQPNERGLPPIPWYSSVPAMTFTTSPTSSTSPTFPTFPARPTGSDFQPQISPTSPLYSRAAHLRSASGQTDGTAASSTAVGSNSTRNSLRSNSGKTTMLAGGTPHKRASSPGAGSSVTVKTLHEVEGDVPGNFAGVDGLPSELHSLPAPQLHTPSDPPSPALEPQLGPLRIVNVSAISIAATDDPDPDDPSLDVSSWVWGG